MVARFNKISKRFIAKTCLSTEYVLKSGLPHFEMMVW